MRAKSKIILELERLNTKRHHFTGLTYLDLAGLNVHGLPRVRPPLCDLAQHLQARAPGLGGEDRTDHPIQMANITHAALDDCEQVATVFRVEALCLAAVKFGEDLKSLSGNRLHDDVLMLTPIHAHEGKDFQKRVARQDALFRKV